MVLQCKRLRKCPVNCAEDAVKASAFSEIHENHLRDLKAVPFDFMSTFICSDLKVAIVSLSVCGSHSRKNSRLNSFNLNV